MRSARRDPRGFVLIIVAVCGVAMVVIAMAIVFTSGAGRLNAVKEVATDRSVTIAEAGMQRATAYANAVIAVEKDFDRALDPSLSVNCASPSSPIAPGTPRYSDAGSAVVEWPSGSGVNYQMVPFNDGAYLTRFDDDHDDQLPNAQLGPFSGNNPAGSCTEGPGAVSNPFRDRNRAAWISVIGIYPGTDPAVAKHQTALRRFFVANASTPPSLMRVGGNLTTGHLMFCADSGDIAVYGNATVSNQTDTCGTLQVQGSITNASVAADCSGYGLSCTHGSDTSGVVFPTPLTVPSASAGDWFTWTSGCNFLIDSTGLYYWNWSNGACAGYAGGPPASSNTCWIPLIYVDGGGNPANPLGWADVVPTSPTAADFRPSSSTAATAFTLPAAGPQSGRVLPNPTNHPNWSTCQGASPYTWRPPSGGSSVACTNCGSGTVRAMSFSGTAFNFNPSDPEAVPAGVYSISGNHTFGTIGLGLPGTDANEVEWPQATFVVSGNVIFSGNGRIGIGTAKSPPSENPPVGYPSLVVGGNLTVNPGANWAFGGSVWVGGSATYDNGSNVENYGPLTVQGNLTIGGGGKLDVVVTTPMVPALSSTVLVAATGSRSLR